MSEAYKYKGITVTRPFPESTHLSLRDFYEWKDKGVVKFAVQTGFPDSYTLEWPTSIDFHSFLNVSCELIDLFKGSDLPPRPWKTGKNTATLTSPGSVTVGPSYSNENYNNIQVSGSNLPRLTFDKLPWPFTLSDLERAAKRRGGEVRVEPDEPFARINAEFFTIILGNRLIPQQGITIWSHIPPDEGFIEFFRKTSAHHGDLDRIRSLINLLVLPLFNNEGKICPTKSYIP